MEAMLDGVLHMDEGCLVVTSQDGATQHVLAVPEGSRINDDGTAVRIGRRTLQIGQHVEFAGGFTTRFELTVPEACAPRIDGAEVFVVSSAR